MGIIPKRKKETESSESSVKKAAVAMPFKRNGIFRFLDLPPELRVVIYEILFGNRVILIMRSKSRDNQTLKGKIAARVLQSIKSPHRPMSAPINWRIMAALSKRQIPLRGIAILAVNCEIHGEAIAVLFGSNDFHFKLPVRLRDWCKEDNIGFESLRTINLHYRLSYYSIGYSLPCLRKADNLRTIAIMMTQHDCTIRRYASYDLFKRNIRWLVQSMPVSCRRNMFDKISFRPRDRWSKTNDVHVSCVDASAAGQRSS